MSFCGLSVANLVIVAYIYCWLPTGLSSHPLPKAAEASIRPSTTGRTWGTASLVWFFTLWTNNETRLVTCEHSYST